MLILLGDMFICSGINASQKAEIVHLVRNLPGSPCTMAVGCGISDILMMKEADLSVGICSKFGSSDIEAVNNVRVADFSTLLFLLLKHGVAIGKRLQMTIYLFIYKTSFAFILFISSNL